MTSLSNSKHHPITWTHYTRHPEYSPPDKILSTVGTTHRNLLQIPDEFFGQILRKSDFVRLAETWNIVILMLVQPERAAALKLILEHYDPEEVSSLEELQERERQLLMNVVRTLTNAGFFYYDKAELDPVCKPSLDPEVMKYSTAQVERMVVLNETNNANRTDVLGEDFYSRAESLYESTRQFDEDFYAIYEISDIEIVLPEKVVPDPTDHVSHQQKLMDHLESAASQIRADPRPECAEINLASFKLVNELYSPFIIKSLRECTSKLSYKNLRILFDTKDLYFQKEAHDLLLIKKLRDFYEKYPKPSDESASSLLNCPHLKTILVKTNLHLKGFVRFRKYQIEAAWYSYFKDNPPDLWEELCRSTQCTSHINGSMKPETT